MSGPAERAPQPRDRHRVFFALWPDDATRAAISRATRAAVRESGGRAIAKDRLHVTVAFLGELTQAGVDAARGVPPIPVGAFEMKLDTLGLWPASKVLWIAPRTPPRALHELEARLWEGLVERGFHPEERIYQPHVTLARRARPVGSGVDPVTFSVHDLALVESFPEGRRAHYEVLERWPL
jgi:2'-5' RNA ligase